MHFVLYFPPHSDLPFHLPLPDFPRGEAQGPAGQVGASRRKGFERELPSSLAAETDSSSSSSLARSASQSRAKGEAAEVMFLMPRLPLT